MNKKAQEVVAKLSHYLVVKNDLEGLKLLNELLAAITEGKDDVLRKKG